MNNIKEVITRLWSHIVNYCSSILTQANAYTDKKATDTYTTLSADIGALETKLKAYIDEVILGGEW